jgi:hypothetical protein
MARQAAHTFEITFKNKPPLSELERLKDVRLTSHDDHNVTVSVQGELPPLLTVLARHEVAQLEVRQLDLEEMFMHYYSGKENS